MSTDRDIAMNQWRENALDRVREFMRDSQARGYEQGYEAGYSVGAARTSAPAGKVARDDMIAILDRIQLFRQSIATYDTRYVALGEIIADFAAKLDGGGVTL